MSEPNNSSENLTALLCEWSSNEQGAFDALAPLIYTELHRQAHNYLRGERPNHTLQTTALINEAYLRLAAQRNIKWQNRAHFFGIAANMMRRILVDYAKTKHRIKRGSGNQDVPIEDALSVAAATTDEESIVDLIALDKALNKMALMDRQQAKIVELRYFSGLSIEETAEVLGISPATVKRDWNVARAWLRLEISGDNTD